MNELSGEIYTPGEGVGGAPEQLSDDAKQRFAAAAAAMQQIRKEEKKSKKRDDKVAQAIKQFLSDKKYAHLFVLISRLVARDCPSIFILAILSLISTDCREAVEQFMSESTLKTAKETVDDTQAITKSAELDKESNRALVEWITRLQLVMAQSPEEILTRLMLDEKNVDGTVLQLTAFVLQEFFKNQKREIPFENAQSFSASILQTVFQPFIGSARKVLADAREKEEAQDED